MSNETGKKPPRIIVVMGVTGSGKTTVGGLLAKRLGIPFYDADNFHPPSNREKLGADIPLTDEDREPWLQALSRAMQKWAAHSGAVLACSSLKHEYRKRMRQAVDDIQFIYLEGDPDTIARRLTRRAQRANHIVKNYKAILKGQFEDLETPTDAITLSIDQPPDQIVDEILVAVDPSSF